MTDPEIANEINEQKLAEWRSILSPEVFAFLERFCPFLMPQVCTQLRNYRNWIGKV